LSIPSWHAVLYDPGEFDTDKFQSSSVDIGLRRDLSGSALPIVPQIRFTRGPYFGTVTGAVFPYADGATNGEVGLVGGDLGRLVGRPVVGEAEGEAGFAGGFGHDLALRRLAARAAARSSASLRR